MEKGWSGKQLETLLEMVAMGRSAREIGDKVGKGRNAVLGKIHRLKLPCRTKGSVRKKASIPLKGLMPPLTDGCQWDVSGAWCGKPTRPGSAYCQDHYQASVMKPQPKLDVDAVVRLSQPR